MCYTNTQEPNAGTEDIHNTHAHALAPFHSSAFLNQGIFAPRTESMKSVPQVAAINPT